MRFVLVHGGHHGAWCWEKVIPQIKALGHEAVAIDMPGHGARPRDEVQNIATFRDAVTEVIRPGDVLVGHSAGGLAVTLAADARPQDVRHVCYLAAAVPIEGLSIIGTMGGGVDADGNVVVMPKDENGIDHFITFSEDGKSWNLKNKEAAIRFFFHDVDPQLCDWAWERFCPESVYLTGQCPVSVPTFWKSDLPRSYIICEDDRALAPAFVALQAKRLGVAPLKIDASHSPFFSKPRELAALLIEAVHTKPVGPLNPQGVF